MNTDCAKCKAPMALAPEPKRRTPLDNAKFTVTGYRCQRCGHWNDLKRRKQKP